MVIFDGFLFPYRLPIDKALAPVLLKELLLFRL
jgi:hypothetical protein